jgi:[acyl-carrier-protein] S-malonyltransferase
MNISLVFPGVGSQYSGMGKTQYNQYKIVKDTFDEVSEIAKTDLAALCFDERRDADLNILANAQICLFTLSIAYYRLLNNYLAVLPKCCCGYSLGEYAALCIAGAFELRDAVKLIELRSTILQKITDSNIGRMVWVVQLDGNITAQICEDLRDAGYSIYVSGYNSQDQTAVSGDNISIDKASSVFEEFGAIVVPLALSGPYHCQLMQEAYDYLKVISETYMFKYLTVPVIANWNACFYEYGNYPQYLTNQLIYPIRWIQSMQIIYDSKPDIIIEVGSKDVLTYISKKNNKDIQIISMDYIDNLTSILDCLTGSGYK